MTLPCSVGEATTRAALAKVSFGSSSGPSTVFAILPILAEAKFEARPSPVAAVIGLRS
jgi:hypothetical protein